MFSRFRSSISSPIFIGLVGRLPPSRGPATEQSSDIPLQIPQADGTNNIMDDAFCTYVFARWIASNENNGRDKDVK
uniref:Uncharacterized protein n=1 Tax=Oryza rufipogon TaxID=4529 RepID=A0A0E0MZZ0_ORYRU